MKFYCIDDFLISENTFCNYETNIKSVIPIIRIIINPCTQLSIDNKKLKMRRHKRSKHFIHKINYIQDLIKLFFERPVTIIKPKKAY